jgi:hypothetical protein
MLNRRSFGGFPWLFEFIKCIVRGTNNPEALQVRENWSELPVSFNYIGIENVEFQNFSENIGFFGNV